MAVIKKYIEFLREYNKLLERGSKNVYRQKDILWLSDIESTSIIIQNSLETLFLENPETSKSGVLLKVKRPKQKLDEDLEYIETAEEKFERDSYSFLYKAARDTNKDTGLEFVYSFGLFSLNFGDEIIKAHLFNIPLKATLLDSNLTFGISEDFDPYIDAYFLNHPQINREILGSVFVNFEEGIAEHGLEYLKSKEFKILRSDSLLALHPKLVFNPTSEKLSESLTSSFVSFSPCFILRRKRPRHFQNLMNKIIEYTDDNNAELKILDILLGQRDNKYIKDIPYFSQLYNEHKEKTEYLNSKDFEAFFPLPYNDEQLAIYNNYKTHDLSVVTGPPGTGKSHSIVNLLCAILAEGKRILITAKTDKALESLLNKIPKQFTGLVMADIQQEHSSDYTLSSSIDSIRALLLDQSTYTIDRDLLKLDKEKNLYLEHRTEMARTLSREYEQINIEHFDKKFDVYQLFQFLEHRYSEWKWIKDIVNEEILKDNGEIVKQLNLLLSLKNKKRRECKLDLENLEGQLDIINFDNRAEIQSKERELLEEMKINSFHDYPSKSVEFILSNLKLFKNSEVITKDGFKLEQVISSCSLSPEVKEDTYVNCTTHDLINNKNQYIRDISTYLALIPKDKEKLSFLQSSFKSGVREVSYLEKITINDSFCKTRQELTAFRGFLNDFSLLYQQTQTLAESNFITNNLNEQCSLPKMRNQVEEGLEKANLNLKLLKLISQEEVVSFSAHYDISRFDIEGLVRKAKTLLKLYESLKQVRNSGEQITNAIDKIKAKIGVFGIREFESNDDVSKAKNAINVSREEHDSHIKFNTAKKFLEAHLPKTTEYLLESQVEKVDCNNDSMHLKMASYRVDDISAVNIQQTIEKLNYHHDKIQRHKANILSGLAGENFKNRFDPTQKNDFVNLLIKFDREFRLSKRGIKDKEKFRRQAQITAQKIAPNISCWVMKFDDVLKTIDEKPNVFDCVIVDEASQLDFNSLLLGYYAKKMIVVGDEKQTSPQSIAIKDDSFSSLRENELSFMGDDAIHIRPDASLFSLSNMVAGTTNQMLKEHFRCVPELIEFSKKHYYDEKIIPLKVISANRLEPKIAEYVENAILVNKEVRKEIDAIKLKLGEILSDPRYEDKSIGVVSLGLANHTTALKTILETLPQNKLEKHNIIIDTPAEFQGDERDVIIVSLGAGIEVDKKGNIKRPTSIVDNIKDNLTPRLRAINVGLSRAKEQMILFHSINSDELKENDFRRQIISFFYEAYSPVQPLELPRDLEKHQRMPENRPKPFDSWFEFDIAKSLIDNGFQHIVPQFEVKKKELFENPKTGEKQYVHFKIDLVVYHNGVPLAIECDGDWFHSEREDVAYDIERQEFLQRIGWKIHRVTYSSYRMDPDKEIRNLVEFIKNNSPKETPPVHKVNQTRIKPSNNEIDIVETNNRKSHSPKLELLNDEDKSTLRKSEDRILTLSNSKRRVEKNVPNNGHNLFSILEESIETKEAEQITLFPASISNSSETSLSPVKRKVEVNSKCKIVMLDSKYRKSILVLKDIARNEQAKGDDGIQVVSIYSDLGKILLGSMEGSTIRIPERKHRIKIEKIYDSDAGID